MVALPEWYFKNPQKYNLSTDQKKTVIRMVRGSTKGKAMSRYQFKDKYGFDPFSLANYRSPDPKPKKDDSFQKAEERNKRIANIRERSLRNRLKKKAKEWDK